MRWADLFEKFRATQERARRHSGRTSIANAIERDERRALEAASPPPVPEKEPAVAGKADKAVAPASTSRPSSGMAGQVAARTAPAAAAREKGRSGLGLGRFAGGGRKGKK